MTTTRDPLNAILGYPESPVASAAQGPLAGATLAVKDNYDVAGYPTGGGNPDKEAESPIAVVTAPAIQSLLDAGARFIGKAQTDELTYSISGLNAHFPPPVNPRARERATGGSSSGSAAAVAGGLADIAIGSDTNGSIRVPASFCGLIGLRITHGRISMEGAMPLAPSFDTFGWFARDASLYEVVGAVLLGEDTHHETFTRPVRIPALEALLFGNEERAAYHAMLSQALDHWKRPPCFVDLPGEPGELFTCFKEIQAYEAWKVHGPFLSQKDRRLGSGVRERFAYAGSITDEQVAVAQRRRAAFANAFSAVIDPDMVVIMPSQPSAAPLKIANQEELESYREKALPLTSIAGLLGWPQITIPLGTVHDAPFGISLLAHAGSDRQLIRLAGAILQG
ncbi:amidase [Chelativorans sp. Marseille-P2723]|uniref:amidase n=1 Tax=Chelativorans sp. Marseille-P2723 TaxID=2709133 RepID=UPI0015713011|nr:amidase [Chelativorans sp. Marseille-P2723]